MCSDARLACVVIVGFLALITFARCSAPPVKESTSCSPTFRELGSGSAQVEVGDWLFSHEVLLIGCKEQLHSLTQDDLQLIESSLADLIQKHHLRFLGRVEEEDFRQLILTEVNAGLSGSPVSDIYFVELGFAERQPVPAPSE